LGITAIDSRFDVPSPEQAEPTRIDTIAMSIHERFISPPLYFRAGHSRFTA
jgi:hypothetical protein